MTRGKNIAKIVNIKETQIGRSHFDGTCQAFTTMPQSHSPTHHGTFADTANCVNVDANFYIDSLTWKSVSREREQYWKAIKSALAFVFRRCSTRVCQEIESAAKVPISSYVFVCTVACQQRFLLALRVLENDPKSSLRTILTDELHVKKTNHSSQIHAQMHQLFCASNHYSWDLFRCSMHSQQKFGNKKVNKHVCYSLIILKILPVATRGATRITY